MFLYSKILFYLGWTASGVYIYYSIKPPFGGVYTTIIPSVLNHPSLTFPTHLTYITYLPYALNSSTHMLPTKYPVPYLPSPVLNSAACAYRAYITLPYIDSIRTLQFYTYLPYVRYHARHMFPTYVRLSDLPSLRAYKLGPIRYSTLP